MKTGLGQAGSEAQGAGSPSIKTLGAEGVQGEESVEPEGFAAWEEGEAGGVRSPGLG